MPHKGFGLIPLLIWSEDIVRQHALSMVVAATCLWVETATAQSPSFDCGKARYPDEIAICRNPELAELDDVVAAAYAYLKSSPCVHDPGCDSVSPAMALRFLRKAPSR